MEITDHPVFEGVDWRTLPTRTCYPQWIPLAANQVIETAPEGLHLPQFIYSHPRQSFAPKALRPEQVEDSNSSSQGFAFSAFFQSSSVSPGLSILQPSPGMGSTHVHSTTTLSGASASFIGFSWGPAVDAFPEETPLGDIPTISSNLNVLLTPKPSSRSPEQQTPIVANTNRNQNLRVPSICGPGGFPGLHIPDRYTTPSKPYAISPHATLPRTSTVLRTAPRRNFSDREAMKRLVDCVGMSARKKVLESGRKPKILGIFSSRNGTGKGGNSGTLKELRFDKVSIPIPGPDYSSATVERSKSRSRSDSTLRSFSHILADANIQQSKLDDNSDIYETSTGISYTHAGDDGYSSSETTDSDGGIPASPSPSPRPGSAMSMTMLSRRSATPTMTRYLNSSSGAPTLRRTRSVSNSGLSIVFPSSVTGMTTNTATTTARSSGLLSVPSTAATETLEFKTGRPPGVRKDSSRLDITGPVSTLIAFPPATTKDFLEQQSSAVPPSDNWLDLEQRHTVMIRNIYRLEERFDEVLRVISHTR
jgi:hypothetical protein